MWIGIGPLPGIVAGEPLDAAAVDILRKEHEAYVAQLSPWEMLVHSMADFGMYFALYVLCGLYVFYREPRVLKDLRKFGTLLACVVATVALVRVLPREWLAEITPIVLFAMVVSIAYSHELSLVLVDRSTETFTRAVRWYRKAAVDDPVGGRSREKRSRRSKFLFWAGVAELVDAPCLGPGD